MPSGEIKFQVDQTVGEGSTASTTTTDAKLVVNCQLVSYDKNKASESIKDITYVN